ncbi:MAG: peptidoglycan-associated lipoprotein Pal [Nitrospinota bacterium]
MFYLGRCAAGVALVAGSALLVGCSTKVVELGEERVALAVRKPVKPPERRPAPPSVRETLPRRPTAREEAMAAERARRRQAFLAEREAFEKELIHFDFDKSELRPDAQEILKRKARFLLRYADIRIQIEGHCDERGTNQYNLALGQRRATSAKNFLASLGVRAERISTISYGEERPLDPGKGETAWAKNRRAKFNITGGVPAELVG